MKRIKIVIVLILGCLSAFSQQESHYTQYMYNIGIINPGYMINEPGIVQLGGLYRTQWVGIEGAPETANVFANIPINDKIELGVNYLNDNIGGNINLSEHVFNINAVYKIPVNNTLNLSFGLKAGFQKISFNALGSNVFSDPLIGNTDKTVLNVGVGAFLFHNNYYIGLSSPNLVPSDLSIDNNVAYNNDAHIFLTGGYVFDIGNDFKLKPSTVVKHVNGAPLTFDVSTNILYLNRFELGASYRYQDAITGLMGINITSDLKIGYAYDFNTSKLKTYNNGSHEFILIYRFDVLGLSKNYASPRFY